MSARAEDGERDQREVVVARQAEDDGADAEGGDGDEQRAADLSAQREAREQQCHRGAADGGGAAQEAVLDRADMQDVLGVDRQQRHGAAEQHGEEVERDGADAPPAGSR